MPNMLWRIALLAAVVGCAAPARTNAVLVTTSGRASAIPVAQRDFVLVRQRYEGDRALAVVAFMDRYWRIPGNVGFNASIDRVESVLREAGYVPEREATSGQRLTYRIESRPMTRPTWEPESASVVITTPTRGGVLLRSATNRNMLAINSQTTPAGGVDAEVVAVAPVSTGVRFDSVFARVDVRGKIVYADGPVSRLFTEAVQKRGAIGVLAYNMPAYLKPEVHRNTIQFSSVPFDSTRAAWGILLSTDARESLRAALAAGPVRVRVAVAAQSHTAVERTLIADVRGSERPDERWVFSAHVQEPGANDNASGVGAQSEMARVLASLVRDRAVDPRRSITFIWGDEIKATQDYLAADTARTRGVRWGMSLDMVGENTALTGGTFLIEKMPDPSAVWTRGEEHHTEWGGSPLAESAIVPHYFNDFVLRRCLDQAAVTGWVVRTNPFEGGSDHTPFLRAKKPGLLFWHFTDEFYHTDGDRIDKVSAAEMTNAGTAALVSALTLVSANGETARRIVGEIETVAMARFETESTLSRAAIAAGGDRAKEAHILEVWGNYYRDAIRAASDVEVGGTSAETQRAIDASSSRVAAAGARISAALR